MEVLFGVIVGLLALIVLVVLHELGHAIVARRNGVVVEEFGIGFPPRAWVKKVTQSFLGKNVEFTLNWLPLGGFVKLKGEYDSADKKGDYGAASYWVKTKILLAGVVANWATAIVLITILAITGLPKVIPDQFTVAQDARTVYGPVQLTAISDGFPAQKAGLQTGDVVTKIDEQQITSSQQLIEATKKRQGREVSVTYEREGKERVADVTLKRGDGPVFGAGLGQTTKTYATWSAPVVGVVVTGQLTLETLKGLGQLIANLATGLTSQLSGDDKVRQAGSAELSAAGDSVAGPVGILGVIFPAAQQAGLTQLTLLVAIVSIALAVMNTLPIPALDGGRWFTMTIFRLLKKPLTKEREEKIQTAGFLALMTLIIVVTIADVGKLAN